MIGYGSYLKNVRLSRVLLYCLLSSAGFVLLNCCFLSHTAVQTMLVLLFTAGTVFEYKVAEHRFFVLPPAVFTAYCFINIMFSGIFYFLSDFKEISQFVVADQSVIRGTWYTMVAVQVLWVFFYLIQDHRINLLSETEIRKVPGKFIYALVFISLSAFFIGIKLNMYGYVADPSKVAYLSYLRFAVDLGVLAIVLLAVYDYDNPRSRIQMYVLVVIYFVVGIAFGSKSSAVLPILMIVVSMYFSGRRIRPAHILAVAGFISAAYAVIEPFRAYYALAGSDYDTASISQLGQMYADAQVYTEGNKGNYAAAFLERNSYVVPLAKTIEFADVNDYYHTEEWGNLLRAPLYAVIPRFIWDSKPLSNFGIWASVNIFDLPDTTHTGITPQGYAYMVFRFAGIMLFFAMSGIIQRLLFNFLYLNRSFIPFYIGMYLQIGYPGVVPWTYVAGMIQGLIFMMPLMILLIYLNKPNRRGTGLHLQPAGREPGSPG